MKAGYLVVALWFASGAAAAQTLGAHFQAQAPIVAHAGYSVAAVQVAGTAVREYVAPSGVIFGIAWEGARIPDLQQWLGPRFAAFQAAARNSRRRGPLYVQVGSLLVENSGHMRAFRGRAVLTDQVPANLSPAVVR